MCNIPAHQVLRAFSLKKNPLGFFSVNINLLFKWKLETEGRRQNHKMMSNMDIPILVIMEILLRLPIKSLVRVRYVCKTWYNIISDPYFTRMHLARAPTASLVIQTLLSYNPGCYSKFYMLEHAEWDTRGHSLFAPLKKLPQKFYLLGQNMILLTSCNGLLCLSAVRHKKEVTCVCNIATGEYMTLPGAKTKDDRFWQTIRGFGYSPKTNQYKLIAELALDKGFRRPDFNPAPRVEVYTLGADSWRIIGDAPYSFVGPYFGTFLNGALHCLIQPIDITDSTSTFICRFDIEKEEFQPFPGPPIQDLGPNWEIEHIHLGASGGFLYLCENYPTSSSVDIWVMKDYGNKQSWMKEFVISNTSWKRGPVYFLNYGMGDNIYALRNFNQLCTYNAKSKCFREVQVCGIYPEFHAIPYTPSLVSLKDAVAGENSKVLCA